MGRLLRLFKVYLSVYLDKVKITKIKTKHLPCSGFDINPYPWEKQIPKRIHIHNNKFISKAISGNMLLKVSSKTHVNSYLDFPAVDTNKHAFV